MSFTSNPSLFLSVSVFPFSTVLSPLTPFTVALSEALYLSARAALPASPAVPEITLIKLKSLGNSRRAPPKLTAYLRGMCLALCRTQR